ncbi:MAG: sulfatase-like hydrolase/transferase [archaeon]|nr:sulfatase-like hydrolase/transferase [archaeon]
MSDEKQKMNILFIITDQHRADHLSCYGNPTLKTPNIDRIADTGVRFNNYYCNTPVCMPNRANFFTGSLPSVHGTRSNGINLNPDITLLTDVLKKKGYHTATIGKNHFQFYSSPRSKKFYSVENIIGWLHETIGPDDIHTPWYGFDEVDLVPGHGDICAGHYGNWLKEKGYNMHAEILSRPLALNEYYYDTKQSVELYPTTYITDRTVEFLEKYAAGQYKNDKGENKPFFLHCSYPDPHHPACPPGKYKDMYNPEDVEIPSNYDDGKNLLDHKALGEYIKNPKQRQLLPQPVSKEEIKKFIAYTYGSIAMIDDGVGRILDTLKKSGLDKNTMVIFTSDHGDFGGDHGIILKGPAHYQGLINIPLLWSIPGITKKAVSDSLVSTIDLPNSILRLLGVSKRRQPITFQGVDINPILENPDAKVRDCVLIEHDEELNKEWIIRVRTMVTEKYRISMYDDVDDFGEIFDLENDPEEVNNLWDSDIDLRNKLVDKLLREIIKNRPRVPERGAFN